MVISQQRGNPIVWDQASEIWVYVDDRSPISVERPCVKCAKMPTPEGYDACLGYIPDAIGACCGHGVVDGYVIDRSGQSHPIVAYVHD